MVTIDNYILFLGGYSSGKTGTESSIFKLEDNLAGSWSLVGNMLSRRNSHCAVTHGSVVIITGLMTVSLFIYTNNLSTTCNRRPR